MIASDQAVAVVAYDCVCAAGLDVDTIWNTLSANGSGVRAIDRYSPEEQKLPDVAAVPYAAQIPISYAEFAGSAERFRKAPEPAYHAVTYVLKRLLQGFSLDAPALQPHRVALIGATALTSLHSSLALAAAQRVAPRFILTQCTNIPLSAAALGTRIRGPSFTIGAACASSYCAVLTATQMLSAGAIDVAILVGFEFPVLPECVGGFAWLGTLFHRSRSRAEVGPPSGASRPFAKHREGFVLGEAVAVVVLARRNFALAAGWPPLAYVLGGHLNSDADHLTRQSLANATRCIEGALRSASCQPTDIQSINAHGTSTAVGDETELRALEAIFGGALRNIPVTANKSQIGHSLGATGLVSLILTTMSLQRGVVLPTLNHEPDPALPQAWIPSQSLEHAQTRVLLNSFGFGGTNACIVLGSTTTH